MTGTRPFEGVEMIIDNMIENFEKVTSHSCGSHSTTNDLVARNAVSNTVIVMSYSLLEGFFHEEYEHYLKKKKPQKPKELSALINTLLHEHNISLNDWRNRRKKVDLIRVLRNAVVYCNGIIEDEIDRDKCKDAFGALHLSVWVRSHWQSAVVKQDCPFKPFFAPKSSGPDF